MFIRLSSIDIKSAASSSENVFCKNDCPVVFVAKRRSLMLQIELDSSTQPHGPSVDRLNASSLGYRFCTVFRLLKR